MAKLTFDEALQRINEERPVRASEVQARALTRKVWVAEWHIPGCLSQSYGYSTCKRDALAEALEMCNHARGAATELRKYGRTDKVSPDAYVSLAITTIEQTTLGDIL